MGEMALQHFIELPVSMCELEKVSKDALAFYSITSYATSELNVIARVLLACLHPLEKETAINAAGFIQSSCVTRMWTLKLFELYDCVEGIGHGKSTQNREVSQVALKAVTSFEHLKSDDGFNLARAIRHEATGHYSLNAARKNLDFVDSKAMATLYTQKRSGNSFYPFGEEVMFVGRLNRFGKDFPSDGQRRELVNTLLEWNKLANGWAHDLHTMVFNQLIAPHLKNPSKRKRSYWVSPEKVGELKDFNVPLFSSSKLESTP